MEHITIKIEISQQEVEQTDTLDRLMAGKLSAANYRAVQIITSRKWQVGKTPKVARTTRSAS